MFIQAKAFQNQSIFIATICTIKYTVICTINYVYCTYCSTGDGLIPKSFCLNKYFILHILSSLLPNLSWRIYPNLNIFHIS